MGFEPSSDDSENLALITVLYLQYGIMHNGAHHGARGLEKDQSMSIPFSLLFLLISRRLPQPGQVAAHPPAPRAAHGPSLRLPMAAPSTWHTQEIPALPHPLSLLPAQSAGERRPFPEGQPKPG